MSKMMNRYVEVSFDLDDTPLRNPQFRAVVVEAGSPRDATLEAKRNVLRAHPNATNIEEFMQRTVSAERAAEITEKMRLNQWQGWFEEGETA